MLKELRDSYLSLRKDYHDLIYWYRLSIERIVRDKLSPNYKVYVFFFSTIKAGAQFNVVVVPPNGAAMAGDIKSARVVIPHDMSPNDLDFLDWSPVFDRVYNSDQEARANWWVTIKDRVYLHPHPCIIGD